MNDVSHESQFDDEPSLGQRLQPKGTPIYTQSYLDRIVDKAVADERHEIADYVNAVLGVELGKQISMSIRSRGTEQKEERDER